VADDTEASRVGEHLPGGLSVGASEAAGAVGSSQGGGALTGPAVAARRQWLYAHRLKCTG
jgi:hypothetical protein